MSCNCNNNEVAGAFEPKMKVYRGSNCHKKDKFYDDCFDKKHHKHDHCRCCCCCCNPWRPPFPFYDIEDGLDDFDSEDEQDSEEERTSDNIRGKPRRPKKYCCPPCCCKYCKCCKCECGHFPPPPPCGCPSFNCDGHFPQFPPNIIGEESNGAVDEVAFPEGSCCHCLTIPTEDGATLCLQQLKFILCQIIELYAGRTFEVLLEDGSTVTGTPDASLFTPPNNGMLVINTLGPESVKVYINISNIVSVRILDTEYGNNIKYILLMCDLELAGTQASIRKLLEVGSTVVITAAGMEFDPSVVLVSALGVVVLQTGNDIQIVATNKISSVVVV